jgi:hypothetical protein
MSDAKEATVSRGNVGKVLLRYSMKQSYININRTFTTEYCQMHTEKNSGAPAPASIIIMYRHRARATHPTDQIKSNQINPEYL